MTTLSLQAKQDFLEKEAATRDPIKGIAELVWNALDADATDVRVEFQTNELGGITAIHVIDNGTGISKSHADRDFSKLGESHKVKSPRTPLHERAVHGKEGRGRLKFFSIASRAVWKTIYSHDNDRFELKLEINANSLERCEVSDPVPTSGEPGTIVQLSPLKETFDRLMSSDAYREFSTVFAPYAVEYPNVKIAFNGFDVDPSITINRTYEIPQTTLVCPTRTIDDLRLKVIEWNAAPDSRQIFFGGDHGVVLGSQAAYVTAPNFPFTAYAYSAFFRELADTNLLELEGLNDPDFLFVLEHIRNELKDYFRKRQADLSKGLIQDLKDQGAYPYDGEPATEVEKRERQVFDIATYAVSSYSRDFAKAESGLKLITLTFLKEAVKHNPDAISTILRAVIGLPKTQQTEFSKLLQRTELSNIISSSSMIADRVAVISMLRQMVFEPKYKSSVKEKGQLDAIVRDNTWLFGEQFHLTLHEPGLTRIMNRVSSEQGSKKRHHKVTKPDGKVGRADQFLGRVIPGPEQTEREYLLIELKRPSLRVGRKELDQVEDYMNALRGQPDFAHTHTKWHFYLITSEYDEAVDARIKQADRARGIAQLGDNYTIWVKTWGEILRECEARHQYIQDKLKVDVNDAEIEDRIQALTQAVVKS